MSADHAHHGEHDEGDTTGTHGMLLFGEDDPLSVASPDVQPVHTTSRCSLRSGSTRLCGRCLVADRQGDGGGNVHVRPAALPDHRAESEFWRPATSTDVDRGHDFRGHFEHGGEPITESVVARSGTGRTFRGPRRRRGTRAGSGADLSLFRGRRAALSRARDQCEAGLRPGAEGAVGSRHWQRSISSTSSGRGGRPIV